MANATIAAAARLVTIRQQNIMMAASLFASCNNSSTSSNKVVKRKANRTLWVKPGTFYDLLLLRHPCIPTLPTM